MRAALLAVAFLTFLLVPAQAYSEEPLCDKPEIVHSTLIKLGLIFKAFTYTDQGYMIEVYSNDDEYFIILEGPDDACIAAHGISFYVLGGPNI